MDQKAVVKLCKELGCCDACCLRFLGLKNPSAYEDAGEYILKYQDESATPEPAEAIPPAPDPCNSGPAPAQNGQDAGPPPAKRPRAAPCVCCLGILQRATWPHCFAKAKEVLDKKGYECSTFACALSAPMSTLLREKAVALRLHSADNQYKPETATPLKEAWKWSLGAALAAHVALRLDSGAVCPLLLTLHVEYADDAQELEVLKALSPALFASRSQQRRRFTVEFTRRAAEHALDGLTLAALQALPGSYRKLSRALPQTPWVVEGRRVMESSVQELICAPIARVCQIPPSEVERRLKMVAAGREDVDVRCLGDGRPFAIEVADPRLTPCAEALSRACAAISASGLVAVARLVPVTREDLTRLKAGEETKAKTYEALCIKLAHGEHDHLPPSEPVRVTSEDIARINAITGGGSIDGEAVDGEAVDGEALDGEGVAVRQRTPLRVLHRRPLHERTRRILALSAHSVPGHSRLLVVRVRTTAGTYVKEWVHGELGRSAPSLAASLGARLDILALDVARVHLPWP